MNTVNPIIFITPDGVARELRATIGARKRISETFGTSDWTSAMTRGRDVGAIAVMLHALMHDRKGQPPDVSIAELEEMLPIGCEAEVVALIMSAFSQGKQSKNELQPQVEKILRETSTGSDSGASASSASESATDNSGGDTSNAKSSPELSVTASNGGS